MLPKRKKVRITGKKLSKLNDDIHGRDDSKCIIKGCGRYVDPREKFHHEPQGNDKEDRIEHGVTLCLKHHTERHSGTNGADIREQCEEYLSGLYPKYWERFM
ncbi:hypothetical protein [Sporomusa sp. KB1]|jgi:hypothetical protein|uniref:hypothetical protein n=1 Tax=Sporomusa sp. KB1 TaxID=943346 RepID=UPI00119C9AEB|nr:hypothetical protein [Sporomusa sp. KB1]TWH49605.1 hypothetical protein Salpa_5844 [Sporomusa sp. KB1]